MITNKFENLHALQSRINTRGLLSDARPSRPILAVKKKSLIFKPYELDCNSSNVAYLLSCKVCHAQYVGSTTKKFWLRFNNHKARFRAHSRLSFEAKNKDDLLYRHFSGPRHHGLEDVSIQLIDRVSGEESALRDKEGQWAYRLNCIQPQGLNIHAFNKSGRHLEFLICDVICGKTSAAIFEF